MDLSALLSAALRSNSVASVHPGSHRLWSTILTAAAVGVATMSGCTFIDHDHRDDDAWVEDDPWQPEELPGTQSPLLVRIDADQVIESPTGEGVGLFVEYGAGGFWRLWTTCDTNHSAQSCWFDACASIVDGSSDIRFAAGEELEGEDRIELFSDGQTCMSVDTDTDIDGVTFETEPGALVRLEVWLDGFLESRYVYWVGDGVLHTGAPTNPVDFAPVSP